MTYGDLVKASEVGLPELLRKEIPIKAAMRVRVINRKVRVELETYHEMRQKLIEQYAQRDDAGKIIVDEMGNARVTAEFWSPFRELAETEAPEIDPLPMDELGDIMVTAGCLDALGGLIQE
jgi:hypothetical protein